MVGGIIVEPVSTVGRLSAASRMIVWMGARSGRSGRSGGNAFLLGSGGASDLMSILI